MFVILTTSSKTLPDSRRFIYFTKKTKKDQCQWHLQNSPTWISPLQKSSKLKTRRKVQRRKNNKNSLVTPAEMATWNSGYTGALRWDSNWRWGKKMKVVLFLWSSIEMSSFSGSAMSLKVTLTPPFFDELYSFIEARRVTTNLTYVDQIEMSWCFHSNDHSLRYEKIVFINMICFAPGEHS